MHSMKRSSALEHSESPLPARSNVQSLSDEMASMDAAVIVRLVKVYPAAGADEQVKAQFEVTDVIKGEKLTKAGTKFDGVYYGDGKPGSHFLVMGIAEPKLTVAVPIA